MATIKKDHNILKNKAKFTVIPNSLINDPRLTGRQRDIIIYLLSKPDGWKVQATDIAKHCGTHKRTIQGDMAELTKAGYISHQRIRDDVGFVGVQTKIHPEAGEGIA